ncbi:alkanesulfonate monooxygenase SsuD/methylene tetrahydromethanopterin reductase-like flavin-dependent oxidoreductase (luciferase family) [Actinocrispum wychmicini]|uniref:Alkanesulfonate monooxygenase SsuD/methylene tetrahydromethanopterin reductase-like flavin-dependent oxidoreductase (Luciferase family) n=2 Tax=Actinocrispum wychmicini TaxID=1213861 RepID=A0A4R2JXI8_9PSEU|nr:alkanesulfonate monooxygenase SsuD/methylene tetrahydromethanopterin reductase-like flavin-dependent oxidoreductase (luciferase family) [Actinocrispum wychmicini]
MDFGMFFELQLPRPWADDDEQRLFHNALEWAELGERAGIGYAWAQEHHFLEEYSHSSAPEVFLAAVSQRTKTMRIGHGVNLMPPQYNHPARVAERIATLDLVSGGRVEWGTGESSSRLELEAFHVDYVKKRALWAEALRECAKMLAANPYPGYSGEFFSMPARNIVPKPVQRPHPPMWVACTNRDTVKLAARLGLGALTFAFMNGEEAAFWVREYYDTFKAECRPIGRAVNPNIAMLAGVMVHRDEDVARQRGLAGQQFFKWALAYYFRFGTHTPGRSDLWREFSQAEPEPMAGIAAVGTPDQARAHIAELEAAGVDQVIFLQQAGDYEHDHVCESLELLGTEVLPEFSERNETRKKRKEEELAPYVEQALRHVPPLPDTAVEPVEAYPVLWERRGVNSQEWGAKRALDAAQLWRLNVGQGGK